MSTIKDFSLCQDPYYMCHALTESEQKKFSYASLIEESIRYRILRSVARLKGAEIDNLGYSMRMEETKEDSNISINSYRNILVFETIQLFGDFTISQRLEFIRRFCRDILVYEGVAEFINSKYLTNYQIRSFFRKYNIDPKDIFYFAKGEDIQYEVPQNGMHYINAPYYTIPWNFFFNGVYEVLIYKTLQRENPADIVYLSTVIELKNSEPFIRYVKNCCSFEEALEDSLEKTISYNYDN